LNRDQPLLDALVGDDRRAGVLERLAAGDVIEVVWLYTRYLIG